MSVNYLDKITELYAFVSKDEGGEGLIGMIINGTFIPFVCADKKRIESLKPHAKNIAKESGKKVKLIKLTCREEIEGYK